MSERERLARQYFVSPFGPAPAAQSYLSIPAIIWSFLTVMWFGFGHLSPIVTTFLTAVPPYYTATECPRVGTAHGDNCPRGR